MSQESCPPESDLRRLLRGDIPEAEAGPLERHFAGCPHCAALAERLGPEVALPSAAPIDYPRGEAIDRLIDRLQALPRFGERDQPPSLSGETLPQDGAAGGWSSGQEWPEVPGYEVLGVLGRGGMGVVYKARQVALDRLVAVKMILGAEHAGPQLLARFEAEARAVARLRHPHIVQIHEIGWAGGQPFLALEFCPGGSLAERLREGPLPPDQAARLVEQVALAVHAAHQADVVHRDLKPANILMTPTEGTGGGTGPKVTDFGLAKRLDMPDRQTQFGDLLGTPSYMAPEQAEGRLSAIGPATDVYAVGAILYECVTGRPPFRGSSVRETLDLVCQADPVPPRQLQPGCPRDLETICLKCLRKEPAKRYATAAAVAEDLRRFLAHEPIRARPVSAAERVAKWARRRPSQAALVGAAVLFVAAGVGAALWLTKEMGRANAAENVAEVQEFFGRVEAVVNRRTEPQPGWTWKNLEDLRLAATGSKAPENLSRLRTEAAAALGAVDVRPARVVAERFYPFCLAYDPRGRWLALGQFRAGVGTPCLVKLVSLSPELASREVSLTAGLAWDPGQGPLPVPDGVRSLAFSPDGRRLFVGTRSGLIVCWDLEQPSPSPTSWKAHHSVDWLSVAADGRSVVSSGTTDRTVKRWSIETGADPGKPLPPEAVWQGAGDIRSLARHPAEGWLACSQAFETHFLSADSLQPIRPPFHEGSECLQFSPDGGTLASDRGYTVWFDNSTSHWTYRHLRLPGREDDRIEDSPLGTIQFSPGGDLLLTACEGTKHVKLWETAGGRLVADLFVGSGLVRAAFAPDGRSFAVTAEGRTLVYEVGGLREQTFIAVQPLPIDAAALPQDGRSLACLSPSGWIDVMGEVAVWPLDTPAPAPARRHTFPDYRPSGNVRNGLAVQPGGGRLAYRREGWLELWDPAGTKALVSVPGEASREARLSFGPTGRLWGAVNKEVRSYNPGDGRTLSRYNDPLAGQQGLDRFYDVAAGRERVAAAGRNGRVYLFDGEGRPTTSTGVAGTPVRSVALSADEALVAAGSDGGDLRLLRADGGAAVAELTPHGDGVTALSFSARGLLASGSRDRTVKLWRRDGEVLTELFTLRCPAAVRWLAFHPDGVRLFVLLDGERAVRVWRLDLLRERLTGLGLGAGLDGIERAELPPAAVPPATPLPPTEVPEGPNGLRAELFADPHLQRCLKVRYDRQIDFDWGDGSPDPLVPNDFFSVRWTGWLKAPSPGKYTVRLEADDCARLWLGGRLLLDCWHGGGLTKVSEAKVELTDAPQEIRVECFELAGKASVRLSWALQDGFGMQPVPGRALYHDRAALPARPPLIQAREVRLISGHADTVRTVSFLPDSHRFLTGGSDGAVRLWEAASGNEVRSFRVLENGRVNALAVGPDGKQALASCGNDVVLLDLATGKELRRFVGHRARVERLAFSPDGHRFASADWQMAGGPYQIRIWDVSTGETTQLLPPERPVDLTFAGLAWAADGKRLYSATQNGDLLTWDVAGGRPLWLGTTDAPGGRRSIWLSLARDQSQAAVVSEGTITLFDVRGDALVQRWRAPVDSTVIAGEFSPDGRLLATGGGPAVRFWNTHTGVEEGCIQAGPGKEFHVIAFAPDGRSFVTAGNTAEVRLWELVRRQDADSVEKPAR